MVLNNVQAMKAIIFKDRKDFYKASEALYAEYRRMANASQNHIAALQGGKDGFYHVMLLVPASMVPELDTRGISYTPIDKQKALEFLDPDSFNFISKSGGLERLC